MTGVRRFDADDVTRRGLGVEGDNDFFVGGGGDEEAGVVGGDGHQAAAAVDEDGELDFGGAAVVEEFIERGFDGAAREEDIVDQNNSRAVDVGGNLRGGELFRDRVATDIVTMEGNVDGASGSGEARVEGGELSAKALGEGDAAVGDTEEEEFLGGAVTGGNSSCELRNRSVDVLGADSLGSGHEAGLRRVGRGVGRLFCVCRKSLRADDGRQATSERKVP